jgi:hypothetical protein
VVALLLLLTVTLLVFSASPASAHSVLLATAPARSSAVPAAPTSVVMTFNEMPRAEFSVMPAAASGSGGDGVGVLVAVVAGVLVLGGVFSTLFVRRRNRRRRGTTGPEPAGDD